VCKTKLRDISGDNATIDEFSGEHLLKTFNPYCQDSWIRMDVSVTLGIRSEL